MSALASAPPSPPRPPIRTRVAPTRQAPAGACRRPVRSSRRPQLRAAHPRRQPASRHDSMSATSCGTRSPPGSRGPLPRITRSRSPPSACRPRLSSTSHLPARPSSASDRGPRGPAPARHPDRRSSRPRVRGTRVTCSRAKSLIDVEVLRCLSLASWLSPAWLFDSFSFPHPRGRKSPGPCRWRTGCGFEGGRRVSSEGE